MSTVMKLGAKSLPRRTCGYQTFKIFRNNHTVRLFENKPSSIKEIMSSVFVCPGNPSIHDCRKYGHALSQDNCDYYPFETLPCIPRGVFRCTAGERLGAAGADKCGCYRNPEYFSFHHSTFYDLHLHLRPYRLQNPNPNKKS